MTDSKQKELQLKLPYAENSALDYAIRYIEANWAILGKRNQTLAEIIILIYGSLGILKFGDPELARDLAIQSILTLEGKLRVIREHFFPSDIFKFNLDSPDVPFDGHQTPSQLELDGSATESSEPKELHTKLSYLENSALDYAIRYIEANSATLGRRNSAIAELIISAYGALGMLKFGDAEAARGLGIQNVHILEGKLTFIREYFLVPRSPEPEADFPAAASRNGYHTPPPEPASGNDDDDDSQELNDLFQSI